MCIRDRSYTDRSNLAKRMTISKMVSYRRDYKCCMHALYYIMKPLLYTVGILGAAAGGVFAYLNSKIHERNFPETNYYFQEHQCSAAALGDKFTVLENIKMSVKESYMKDLFSLTALYYDNPKFLVDPDKFRTAIGFAIEKDPPQADKDKLTAGMSHVKVPSFKGLTIPMHFNSCQHMFQLYYRLLLRKYKKLYSKQLDERRVLHPPVAEVYAMKGRCVFMPLPEEVRHFEFLKTCLLYTSPSPRD
eukprot:TRINITY_DN12173_c0_g1_i6.p1 TRINITY_DN12173_c0_g1~~TRINITY_DN12173_c0_g1_i6.p1  ORF type:complete len:246 (-),score=49.71 TRINITY_DN12173_c0_g1_i6:76-813(-)